MAEEPSSLIDAPSHQDLSHYAAVRLGARVRILLCMQALEGHIDMRWGRSFILPLRKHLVSRGQRIPTFIPEANRFAEHFAKIAGGTAMTMLGEILFDIPGTAHCLGRCVMADSPSAGVVDSRHRVFGYLNMYTCDGSVVSANLGVNPSLTITAMTERAMSFIPPVWVTTWDDAGQPAVVSVE